MSTAGRLLIAGNSGGTNIGSSLLRAAQSLGVEAELEDARQAYAAPKLVARFHWWLRDRRPARLAAYSGAVVDRCRRQHPRWLIATGLAPIEAGALEHIRAMGVVTMNYLTDDPWNPAFKSAWFLSALEQYDRVFSVRRRNLDDLRRVGCRHVEYLPFGVDPDLFFPETLAPSELQAYRSDVCFVGGGDPERVEYIAALMTAGLDVGLYGDYWGRYAATRRAWRGHAPPEVLRKATSASAVSLCMIRRANRDGHTMRSFEVPAMAACMLAEDTDEHRAMFGDDNRAVVYFRTAADAIDAAKALLADAPRRRRLAEAGRAVITAGQHTYCDRLLAMLEAA